MPRVPFAKSTLQMFRAQLILHDKVREVFEGSLRLARQSGYLKKRGMRVALDTTYILGRGAVKDTYNLLADGIVKLLRVLAAVANIAVGEWAAAQGYERYFGSSIKGEATIDWSDRKAQRKLLGEIVAKVPGRPNRSHFPKHDFHLDLAAGSCTCPAGQVTRTIVPAGKRTDRTGRVYRLQAFQFDGAVCRVCPLRSQCIAAQGRQGRRVLIHPQEALLQQARTLQQSAAYDEYRARRVVVEHRLARLVQLGIRQSRYFGRVKTKFQLYLAATVANLTLVASKIGLLGSIGGGAAGHRVVLTVVANAAANFSAVRLGQLWSLILLTSALLPKSLSPTRAFRPGF